MHKQTQLPDLASSLELNITSIDVLIMFNSSRFSGKVLDEKTAGEYNRLSPGRSPGNSWLPAGLRVKFIAQARRDIAIFVKMINIKCH
ncbi:MAG: hypothetical protein JZU50_03465 [Desulfobulbaceae bacterium]|jgi:hypothetical protein|nr:hypothetical protein [Desulfobulbaceae bacterium]